MKKLVLLAGIAFALASCGGSSNTQVIDGVTVEVVTITDTVSGQKKEYQQDPKTKNLHGYYKVFHPNGKVFQEYNHRNGVKHGTEKTYFESGKLRAEANLKNGTYDGVAKEFFENGKVMMECTYVADKIEGEMKSYYENGNLKETVTFKNGEENGAFVEYFESGKKQAEGSYMSTKEHGLLQEYNENGDLIAKKKCREGVCCTFWKEGADVPPANELCAEIISTTPDK